MVKFDFFVSLVVRLLGQTAIVVAPHALLVAKLETILALGDLRDVPLENQLLFVHANLAHFARLLTSLNKLNKLLEHQMLYTYRTLRQVMFDQEVEIVDLNLKECWLANKLESQIAIA